MNNMESKVIKLHPSGSEKSDLRRLSLAIGDFIRYWGFRRVHGAIWAQIYLSRTPLSCTDLTERLGLSKALISPALMELVEHRLIREEPTQNEKTKVYTANSNINEVIKGVLRSRETQMLKKITNDFAAFSQSSKSDENIDTERVQSLGEMILAANLVLEELINSPDLLG